MSTRRLFKPVLLVIALLGCLIVADGPGRDPRAARGEGVPDVPAGPPTVTLAPPGPPPHRPAPPPLGGPRPAAIAPASLSYDPTSVYDQKGSNAPRGFSALAPAEQVDPFTGNVIIRHTDLHLPGVAGLDLTLQRVYNSKIHRNYAARVTGDTSRVNNGMLFVPTSPLGLGWNLHLGRLVGATQEGRNDLLSGSRYYEESDGSQHAFFVASGPVCGVSLADCLVSKRGDRLYRASASDPWQVATAAGRNITFDHTAFDGSQIVHYATEIRDIHGNRIRIGYHGSTIAGISEQNEYFKHFIDYIDDSAGRRVDFGYTVVNAPGVVRLTSIRAVGRTYGYGYSGSNPWSQTQAFLTRASPPEGAPWRYEYAGLDNGDCAANDKRWCELTEITYPAGGTITYRFDDHIFWAHTNPVAVRAVGERRMAGRAVTPGTWTYTYNRAANYSDDEHTIVTRPDGSQEVYTYFGVASGPFSPVGFAWKAGVLLQLRIRDGGRTLQRETYDWVAGPAISDEIWGDPWNGFDTGVVLPRLRQRAIERGNLTWTTTHTSFDDLSNQPRCTIEEGDGATRRGIRTYRQIFHPSGDFRFLGLAELEGLSFDDFGTSLCTGGGAWTPDIEDELTRRSYTDAGLIEWQEVNGIRTAHRYRGDGAPAAVITYQGPNQTNGSCTTLDNYQYGVARTIGHGAAAPGCGQGLFTEERTLNPDGSVARETDGRGNGTDFVYDGLGRAVRITPPGETTLVTTFDGSASSPSTQKRVEQGSFWFEERYDGFGRKIAEETSGGVHVQRTYDALGRLRFQSQPGAGSGSTQGDTFAYDALGRVESVTHEDGSRIRYAHGTSAHTVTITDEEDRDTIQTRRSFGTPGEGWLIRVQRPGEPAPTRDTFSYLVGGHLTAIDYAGRQRSIAYNFAKRVIREDNPESGSLYTGYDAGGNPRCKSRAAGTCSDSNFDSPSADVRYTVDRLARVTEARYGAGGGSASYTYDDAGNLATMTDAAGTHTFEYTRTDRPARRVSTIAGVTYTTAYGYDSRGNLETLTYPSGRVVTYGRDAGNRITRVADPATTFVTDIDYHPSGPIDRITYGNGVVTALTLDNRQRPDRLHAPGVLELNYDHDDVGNVTRVADSLNADNTTAFDYDDLDRLTDASGGWGTLHYDYDAAGNRAREVLNGQPTTHDYDNQGRLRGLSGRINLTYDYDTFGNVIQRGGFGYVYDAENRLAQVTGSGAQTYTYDGQGARLLKTGSGCPATRVSHYDSKGTLIAESSETGLILKDYVVADGRTIAELDLQPLRADPGAIDFGDVPVRTTVTQTLTLTNRSADPISLSNLTVPFPFRIIAQAPLVVAPQATVQVPVTYAPFARGAHQATVAFCNADGVGLDLTIRGRAVAPVAELSPPEIDFGEVAFGTTVTRTVVVSNTGDAPLLVTGWTRNANDPRRGGDRFGPIDGAITLAPGAAATVRPGESYSVTLSFDSLLTWCDGPYRGTLDLGSNSQTSRSLTVRANVVGMEVVTPEVSFGPVAAGGSQTLNVTVRNRASVPVTPTIALAGAPQFRVAALPAGQVAPGAHFDVPVTYRPTDRLWSPFGDHAKLTSSRAGLGCEADCGARGHLIGNVAAEPPPVTGISPTLAIAGDAVHLAAQGNGTSYAVRDAARVWSAEPDPAGPGATRPALLTGSGERLTLLWHDPAVDQIKLRQRSPGGGWGDVCVQDGRRSGWSPLASDAAGSTWLGWFDPAQAQTLFAPIFSAAGACQPGQATIQIPGEIDEINLVNGPAGVLGLAGAYAGNRALAWGDLDPVAGTSDFSDRSFAASVNAGTGPAQAVDAAGRWYAAWAGDATFFPWLGLEGRDQALYSFETCKGCIFEMLPLMRDSAGAESLRLAVDSLDNVHIAWTDRGCAAPGQRRIYYVTGRPSAFYPGWQAVDVSPPGYAGADPSIALSLRDDRLVAVWPAPGTSGGQLHFGEAGVGARGVDVTTGSIAPGQGGSVGAVDGRVGLQFPAGAVGESTTVTYTERLQPARSVGNFRFGGRSFSVEARAASGGQVTTFARPYTLTVEYDDADWQQAGILDERTLNLHFWNGSAWIAVLPCAGCSIDTAANRIVAVLDHLTEFAILAPAPPAPTPAPTRPAASLYLPLVGRAW